MLFYIKDYVIRKPKKKSIRQAKHRPKQCVAILTKSEWLEQKEYFSLGTDVLQRESDKSISQAEVNYSSITGTFSIPNRKDFAQPEARFSFIIDDRGIIFIDDTNTAKEIITKINKTKVWKLPSLERFIYDFLEQIVCEDQKIMTLYERQLDNIEHSIFKNHEDIKMKPINTIRNNMRDLRIHYEQLLDIAELFDENENNFFVSDNLRYFRMFINKIERLRDYATSVCEQAIQVRDLFNIHLEIKQNKIVTTLTIVTTIFMPLTLVVGWYGMNFKYMPEVNSKWGYPAIIILCLTIIIISIVIFKKKKWL